MTETTCVNIFCINLEFGQKLCSSVTIHINLILKATLNCTNQFLKGNTKQ